MCRRNSQIGSCLLQREEYSAPQLVPLGAVGKWASAIEVCGLDSHYQTLHTMPRGYRLAPEIHTWLHKSFICLYFVETSIDPCLRAWGRCPLTTVLELNFTTGAAASNLYILRKWMGGHGGSCESMSTMLHRTRTPKIPNPWCVVGKLWTAVFSLHNSLHERL